MQKSSTVFQSPCWDNALNIHPPFRQVVQLCSQFVVRSASSLPFLEFKAVKTPFSTSPSENSWFPANLLQG